MVAFILSNLAVLLAKMLTANAFGTGMESEAFYAANRFSKSSSTWWQEGHWDRLLFPPYWISG
jgi:hypothetical protein